MVGGILVQTWSWRATFWVLVVVAAVSIILFQFFKETFRRERSLAYQAAQDRALTLADVNPVGPAWLVLKQKTNLSILFASGERHDF
jgi:predicted MFS family arabinose efflux permease